MNMYPFSPFTSIILPCAMLQASAPLSHNENNPKRAPEEFPGLPVTQSSSCLGIFCKFSVRKTTAQSDQLILQLTVPFWPLQKNMFHSFSPLVGCFCLLNILKPCETTKKTSYHCTSFMLWLRNGHQNLSLSQNNGNNLFTWSEQDAKH